MREKTREERLENALKTLIEKHFYSKYLQWSWREGVTLISQDNELYVEIASLIPEVINSK